MSSIDKMNRGPAHFASDDQEMVVAKRRLPQAHIFAALVIIAQLIVITVFAFAKQGYFVDELWSYGLANSLFFPHIFQNGAMDGQWIIPQELHSYLEVDPGEQFRFDSVIYNMSNDAHPPLFFLVLHFACSLLPGTFSKWYGIVPNMIYFVVSAILLYRISRKILGSDYKALLPLVWWGFCPGTISLVLFIRMYMMASMFVLASVNVHYDMLVDGEDSPAKFAQLAIAAFLGFMCHYFMFILAFFLAAFSCIYLLIQKRWKTFVIYAGIMVASVLLVFAVFPASLKNLFGNGYAQQGTSHHTAEEIVDKVLLFYSMSDSDLFAGVNAVQTLVLLLTIAGIAICLWKSSRTDKERKKGHFSLVLVLSSACFFIVVAVAAPWASSRYVCFIYPFVIIAATWAILFELDSLLRDRAIMEPAAVFVIGAIVLVGSALSYGEGIDYIYPQEQTNMQVIGEQSGSESLLITKNYYKVIQKALEVEELKGIWATTSEDSRLANAMEQIDQSSKSFLVYIDPLGIGDESCEEVMDRLIEGTRFDSYQLLPGYEETPNDGVDLLVYQVSER